MNKIENKIEDLNKIAHQFFCSYEEEDYHPHKDFRKHPVWDDARRLHVKLNVLKNGLPICCICNKVILNKPVLHHFWIKNDYKTRKKWLYYFNPDECGLICKDCHQEIHEK